MDSRLFDLKRAAESKGYCTSFVASRRPITELSSQLQAEQIAPKIEKRSPNPNALLVPAAEDGVDEVKFVSAMLHATDPLGP